MEVELPGNEVIRPKFITRKQYQSTQLELDSMANWFTFSFMRKSHLWVVLRADYPRRPVSLCNVAQAMASVFALVQRRRGLCGCQSLAILSKATYYSSAPGPEGIKAICQDSVRLSTFSEWAKSLIYSSEIAVIQLSFWSFRKCQSLCCSPGRISHSDSSVCVCVSLSSSLVSGSFVFFLCFVMLFFLCFKSKPQTSSGPLSWGCFGACE